ncbi:hypothetical protein V2I52_04455 [Brenneria sp. g21c3]|uniref:hypothetical protein n=1 Tax=Brenneria sp. g21c3 TaxID=3093893 RepID=UPI002EB6E67D|nr:hypothetical protein [Brenneria sp. g21c3]
MALIIFLTVMKSVCFAAFNRLFRAPRHHFARQATNCGDILAARIGKKYLLAHNFAFCPATFDPAPIPDVQSAIIADWFLLEMPP